MPVGGRTTHSFPNGTPLPIWLLTIGVFVAVVFFMIFTDGLAWWYRASAIGIPIVAYSIAYSRLVLRYEQTGRAVRLPRRPSLIVRYPSGLPRPMLVARSAFFVTVATMFVFGLAPVPEMIARRGIIGCVFALIAVAILNLSLERKYVERGRAVEVDVNRTGDSE